MIMNGCSVHCTFFGEVRHPMIQDKNETEIRLMRIMIQWHYLLEKIFSEILIY